MAKDKRKTDINLSGVAVIGAGGIGSHFCRLLYDMQRRGQLPALQRNSAVTVYDFDVVEPKNLPYQDYDEPEVGMYKAAIMGLRYEMSSCYRRFDENCLADHTFYIICADNQAVRKLIYERHGGQGFLDMRSEGDIYGIFTHETPKDVLMKSLGDEPDSAVGRSCQLAEDLRTRRVKLGNRAVAVAGMQMLLNIIRGEDYPPLVTASVV